MPAKSKSTSDRQEAPGRAEQAGNAAGDEAFKQGFGKAMEGYGELNEFSKDTVEALISSANIASRGLEVLNSESLAFSKQSVEDGVSVAKAAMAVRSVQELIEIQNDFTRSAFDSYLGQVNRAADLFAETTKEAVEPLNERFNVLLGLVQANRS